MSTPGSSKGQGVKRSRKSSSTPRQYELRTRTTAKKEPIYSSSSESDSDNNAIVFSIRSFPTEDLPAKDKEPTKKCPESSSSSEQSSNSSDSESDQTPFRPFYKPWRGICTAAYVADPPKPPAEIHLHKSFPKIAIRDAKFADFTIKQLDLDFYRCPYFDWPYVFSILDKNVIADSLTDLRINLPKTEDMTESHAIARDCKTFRLNLPHLEKLELGMSNYSSLDFLLPMTSSLQELRIEVNCDISREQWRAPDVEKEQIVQFWGYFGLTPRNNRAYDSNIWRIFPKLTTMVVEILDVWDGKVEDYKGFGSCHEFGNGKVLVQRTRELDRTIYNVEQQMRKQRQKYWW